MASAAYNEKYHDLWAWSLALKGATDAEIAEAFGISARTLHRWKKNYPSLKEKLAEGKEVADSKVEYCLYERATGYDAKDVEQYVETDKVTGRQEVKRTRVLTKHIPPDVGAICFWLKNRKPDKWKDRGIQLPDIDVFRDIDKVMVKIQDASENVGDNANQKAS